MKLACLISGYNNPVSIKDNVKRVEKHVNLIPTKFFNNLAPPLAAAFLLFSPICATPACRSLTKDSEGRFIRGFVFSIAQTIDIQRGATLFSQTCIGCHDAGGNIIQPGSTLFTKDLQRNGVDTEEEIYRVTYYGKGRMPGFGKECMPRGQCTFGARLEDEDIKILAEFVKLQADKGWPSIETEQK